MGSSFIDIVPVHEGDYPEAEAKAREIAGWFIGQGLVEPTPSDCIMSTSKTGYRFTPRIGSVFTDWPGLERLATEPLKTFGLELHHEGKRVFHPMEDAQLEMRCPACGHVHEMDEAMEFIGPWFDGSQERPACAGCGKRSHISAYGCEPDWGFSNLGVSLWNVQGTPRPEFVEALRVLYGTETVRVVLGHL